MDLLTCYYIVFFNFESTRCFYYSLNDYNLIMNLVYWCNCNLLPLKLLSFIVSSLRNLLHYISLLVCFGYSAGVQIVLSSFGVRFSHKR